jgi:hypothetical protein
MLSGLPFISKAACKDPQVAALAPLMLVVRAASLGAGVLTGLVMLFLSPKSKVQSPKSGPGTFDFGLWTFDDE